MIKRTCSMNCVWFVNHHLARQINKNILRVPSFDQRGLDKGLEQFRGPQALWRVFVFGHQISSLRTAKGVEDGPQTTSPDSTGCCLSVYLNYTKSTAFKVQNYNITLNYRMRIYYVRFSINYVTWRSRSWRQNRSWRVAQDIRHTLPIAQKKPVTLAHSLTWS